MAGYANRMHVLPRKLITVAIVSLLVFVILLQLKSRQYFAQKQNKNLELVVNALTIHMAKLRLRVSYLELRKSIGINNSEMIPTALLRNATKEQASALEPKLASINEFWKTDDELEQEAQKMTEIIEMKNENHTTCLVTTQQCKQHYQIIILITTHANNFARRNVIRNTWGFDPSRNSPRWLTRFLIARPGTKIQAKKLLYEISKYNDIILGRVNEDFYQLTYKVQMGFEWSVKYCSYDYLFKSDDDVFINMPRLFSFIKDLPKKGVYAGHVQYVAVVQRTGRYAVSKEEFARDIYPRYCSGGGFLLSRDVVKSFLDAFPGVTPIKIDDAYVGLLALNVGVDVTSSDLFRMTEDEKKCKLNFQYVTFHPVKTSHCMKLLFNQSFVSNER